ncbi:hypothetical protein J6590_071425, partial [Homalodisca vitripennis]
HFHLPCLVHYSIMVHKPLVFSGESENATRSGSSTPSEDYNQSLTRHVLTGFECLSRFVADLKEYLLNRKTVNRNPVNCNE